MNDLITIINCKNCGQQIENYNFCPDCGAKKITKRITFKNLIAEFVDRFLNLDNSFVRTFIHLFTKPEQVIDGYIHGLRKKYVNAFGYFAISITITGFYSFIIKDRMFELATTSMSSFLPEEELQNQIVAMETSFQYQSIISFILIPILAIMSRLVFFNYKKYNFTEHLVIYLYAYSHIVGIFALLQIPFIFALDNYFTVIFAPFIGYLIYIGYVLKRMYSISLKKIILKTFLFLGVFLLSIIVFTIFVAILGFLSAAIKAN